MSQPSARRPLDEFDFAGLFRFGPDALSHDLGRDCVLVFAVFFRQVHKRTGLCFQVLNAVVNFTAIEFVEAGNQPFDEIELAVKSNSPISNSPIPWGPRM